MKNLSLPTAMVIVATIAAVVLLLVLGKPVPAGLSGLLGTVLAGALPALVGPRVETLTAELMQTEPVAVSIVEHLEQNPDVAARLRTVLGAVKPLLLEQRPTKLAQSTPPLPSLGGPPNITGK